MDIIDSNTDPDFVGDLDKFLANHHTENLVLDICLPHDSHLKAALTAERMRIPYIMEKPLTRNLQEAKLLIQVNRRSGLPAMVAENWVHIPVVNRLIQFSRRPDAGRPRLFEAHMESKPGGSARPWYFDADVAGGGVLLSGGVHQFSVARRLLGEPIRLSWADNESRRVGGSGP